MIPAFVKKHLGEGKALPKPVRFIIDAEFQRKFTWGERWRILWGYTAIISYRGLAQHSPGSVEHNMKLELSKQLLKQP